MIEPSTPMKPADSVRARQFAEQAMASEAGLVAEIVDFLRHNKKWYLTPVLAVLLLLGLLIVLSGTGLAPFIYPLF